MRDGRYAERCREACDELDFYERRPNGSYGARQGRHDDMLMTRAIALHVCREESADEDTDPELTAYLSSWGDTR